MSAQFLLFLIVLLQVKHLIADFMLQSAWIVRNKGTYGHPGGMCHAVIHAVFSLPVLLMTPLQGIVILWFCVAEFAIHYHIDWSKERLVRRMGATPSEWRFWAMFGADQFAHQVTYVAMLGAVLLLT